MKKTHFFLDTYTKIKNINIILVRGTGCGKDEGESKKSNIDHHGRYVESHVVCPILKIYKNKNTYTHHHYYKTYHTNKWLAKTNIFLIFRHKFKSVRRGH